MHTFVKYQNDGDASVAAGAGAAGRLPCGRLQCGRRQLCAARRTVTGLDVRFQCGAASRKADELVSWLD